MGHGLLDPLIPREKEGEREKDKVASYLPPPPPLQQTAAETGGRKREKERERERVGICREGHCGICVRNCNKYENKISFCSR